MQEYIEIQPSNRLKDYVECFWIMKKEASNEISNDIIIPNGCCEIVFPNGEGYLRSKDGINYQKVSEAVVIGKQEGFYLLKEVQDNSIDFGVRFTPYGFAPLINGTLKSIDHVARLDTLCDDLGLKLIEEITDSETLDAKLKNLENFILKLTPEISAVNNLLKDAVALIHQSQGLIRVGDLIDLLGTSKSTLTRTFIQIIGYTPKKFISICRINYLIHYFINNSVSLTELAYQFNYSDQSHFINDFKKYTGLSPKKYFSENFNLTGVLTNKVSMWQKAYA